MAAALQYSLSSHDKIVPGNDECADQYSNKYEGETAKTSLVNTYHYFLDSVEVTLPHILHLGGITKAGVNILRGLHTQP